MNKKGVTIIELLISISLISVVVLLILRAIFSLDIINNDNSYASNDEISRVEIIKKIESDFLSLKLQGVDIKKDRREIIFNFSNTSKTLKIEENKLIYDNEVHTLESKNATYNLCPSFKYTDIDSKYYLLNITIPVLINNKNTTKNDDIILTYLNLKSEFNSYPESYTCN